MARKENKTVSADSGGSISRIHESEAVLRAILDTAVDGMITIDEKGAINSFNRAAETLFGYAANEVLGKNVKMLMPAPYTMEHDTYLANYVKTGKAKIIGIGRVVEGLRKNGTTFPMELSVSEVKIKDRRLFAGIVRDISERKAAAEERKRSEARIKGILDSTVDAIITINSSGKIQSLNPAGEKMFGYTEEEILGKNVKTLMPEPYKPEHDDYLANYRKTEIKKIIGIGREVTGKRKDESTFPMDLSVSEVVVGKEQIFTGIVRDATERKVFEEKILKHRRELEEAVKIAEERERQQQEDLLELSTPVLAVWEGILALPLIGTLDSRRTEDAMERALTRLTEARARILIIDITGVPIVDTMVANHLIQMASAIRLIGGDSILTGISPAIAKTIVQLGIDLSMIITRGTLAEGLKLAINMIDESEVE